MHTKRQDLHYVGQTLVLKITRWAHLMQMVEIKTAKNFLTCHFYQYIRLI
jgi:hypothetical protein